MMKVLVYALVWVLIFVGVFGGLVLLGPSLNRNFRTAKYAQGSFVKNRLTKRCGMVTDTYYFSGPTEVEYHVSYWDGGESTCESCIEPCTEAEAQRPALEGRPK